MEPSIHCSLWNTYRGKRGKLCCTSISCPESCSNTATLKNIRHGIATSVELWTDKGCSRRLSQRLRIIGMIGEVLWSDILSKRPRLPLEALIHMHKIMHDKFEPLGVLLCNVGFYCFNSRPCAIVSIYPRFDRIGVWRGNQSRDIRKRPVSLKHATLSSFIPLLYVLKPQMVVRHIYCSCFYTG